MSNKYKLKVLLPLLKKHYKEHYLEYEKTRKAYDDELSRVVQEYNTEVIGSVEEVKGVVTAFGNVTLENLDEINKELKGKAKIDYYNMYRDHFSLTFDENPFSGLYNKIPKHLRKFLFLRPICSPEISVKSIEDCLSGMLSEKVKVPRVLQARPSSKLCTVMKYDLDNFIINLENLEYIGCEEVELESLHCGEEIKQDLLRVKNRRSVTDEFQ